MLRPVRYLGLALALLCMAGCGESEPPPDEQVRTVVTEFGQVIAAKDYGALCDRILAPSLVEDVESIGLPCEEALRQGLGEREDPRLSIGEVRVNGDEATADIRTSAAGEEPSRDTLRLQNLDGTWRITSLGT